MPVRFFLAAALFVPVAAAQAQTPPQNPALPSVPSARGMAPPPGAAAPGMARRRPIPNQASGQAQQGGAGADTRQIQNETDELYREIMRRSAPPAQR
ncbi:MAG TPA: hypothetical protein VE993_01320 [Stellaceae bacterium]|nr:hypothetical protein [Stellaceae bacterium]